MMLTGEKLGEAIAAAIQKKIDSGAAKSKAEIARRFGIKPSFNPRYPDRLVGPDDMQSLAVAGEVVYRSGSGFL